ncbi:MAG: asparagine synthase-related protein [Endomicrobia bacterium]|nr:asparagine synthase-related protein [Endomicrobiia bacterium]
MSRLIVVYNYSASAQLREFGCLKRVSNGKVDVCYDDADVRVLKNDASGLRVAKGFLPGKAPENASVAINYDSQNEKLAVSRGILGSVPFYFYDDGKALFFSTHIGIFAALAGGITEVNSLDSYFTHKAVTAPGTIYKNIYALKPGETINKSGKEKAIREVYEDIKFKPDSGLKLKESAAALKETLVLSVSSILSRNPETAVFLSGGLDSNITASLAVKQGVKEVFSAKINNDGFDESVLAKKAAKFYSMTYNEVPVGCFTYDDLFEIAQTYEQPFADASAYPIYKLMRAASSKYKSFLTGDGADELFGGYLRYRAVKTAAAVPKIVKKPFKAFGSLFKTSAGERSLSGYIKKFSSAFSSSVCDVNASLYACFSEEEKRALFNDKSIVFKALDEYKSFCSQSPSLSAIFESDIKLQLADCFSLKIFYPAEKFGISVSSPFYDNEVVGFSQKVPEKFKTGFFGGKIILKEAFKNDVPDFAIKKRKRGFGIPLNLWFRTECKDLAYELLLSERALSSGYFNKDFLTGLLDDHMSFRNNNGQKIWALCMFEMWKRTKRQLIVNR